MSKERLQSELETALQTTGMPVVLDFYADWCMPCRMQATYFQQAEAALRGQAEFYKVDIEAQPELAARFEVRSIPTIVIVRDGLQRWRSVGVADKDHITTAVLEVAAG